MVFLIWLMFEKFLGFQFGNMPMSETNLYISLILSIVFALSIQLLFRNSNLVIEVTQSEFLYKYFPFHLNKHSIKPMNVLEWNIRPLKPLFQFGGWGIRYGFGGLGKGYIADGNFGILFKMINHEKILFSCLNAEKMQEALSEVFGENN